jgi:hypothetical protein
MIGEKVAYNGSRRRGSEGRSSFLRAAGRAIYPIAPALLHVTASCPGSLHHRTASRAGRAYRRRTTCFGAGAAACLFRALDLSLLLASEISSNAPRLQPIGWSARRDQIPSGGKPAIQPYSHLLGFCRIPRRPGPCLFRSSIAGNEPGEYDSHHSRENQIRPSSKKHNRFTATPSELSAERHPPQPSHLHSQLRSVCHIRPIGPSHRDLCAPQKARQALLGVERP